MTEFMKAVLKHFDFTTPKALKITPRDEEKNKTERGHQENENKRVWKKKVDFPFNFYTIDHFEVSGEKKVCLIST